MCMRIVRAEWGEIRRILLGCNICAESALKRECFWLGYPRQHESAGFAGHTIFAEGKRTEGGGGGGMSVGLCGDVHTQSAHTHTQNAFRLLRHVDAWYNYVYGTHTYGPCGVRFWGHQYVKTERERGKGGGGFDADDK